MAAEDLTWSDEHKSRLAAAGKNLEHNWITENASDAEDETEEMLHKAFRYAFHAGAGCSRKLTEMGV